MRTYFTFVFDYPQLNDTTIPWNPAMNLFLKYTHLKGIVTVVCDIAGDERTKEFTNADGEQEKWGYRLGYMEADDAVLANFGTSVADVIAKADKVLSQYDITALTTDETLAYLRKWTTLEEVEPGKFLVNGASTGPNGDGIPAQYLEIA